MDMIDGRSNSRIARARITIAINRNNNNYNNNPHPSDDSVPIPISHPFPPRFATIRPSHPLLRPRRSSLSTLPLPAPPTIRPSSRYLTTPRSLPPSRPPPHLPPTPPSSITDPPTHEDSPFSSTPTRKAGTSATPTASCGPRLLPDWLQPSPPAKEEEEKIRRRSFSTQLMEKGKGGKNGWI
jgi:hypothetical protein